MIADVAFDLNFDQYVSNGFEKFRHRRFKFYDMKNNVTQNCEVDEFKCSTRTYGYSMNGRDWEWVPMNSSGMVGFGKQNDEI